MTVFAWIFPGGKAKDNVTVGASNFSEDTSNHKITVPSGKRWFFFGGAVNRDQNATVTITIRNSSNQTIIQCSYQGAGTGWTNYPEMTGNEAFAYPIPLKAGDYILFAFGAAQGAAASLSAIVLEVDV